MYMSYYHHQIGSMTHLPLLSVRSCNNGICYMSLYFLMGILIDIRRCLFLVNRGHVPSESELPLDNHSSGQHALPSWSWPIRPQRIGSSWAVSPASQHCEPIKAGRFTADLLFLVRAYTYDFNGRDMGTCPWALPVRKIAFMQRVVISDKINIDCWLPDADWLTMFLAQKWRHDRETTFIFLAFCEGIHWSPVDSPHKGPVVWNLKFYLLLSLTSCWTKNELLRYGTEYNNDKFFMWV